MSRLRQNFAHGTITDNPLSDSATTINSAELADLVAVSGGDTLAIILDPEGDNGDPEIVSVTAHTASATSVTVTRGAESTTAREHASGTVWAHGATSLDFTLEGLKDPSGAEAGQVLKVNSDKDGYEFGSLGMKRTINDGIQALPSTLVAGTTVSLGDDTFGAYAQFTSGLASDIYIVGATITFPSTNSPQYALLEIATGAAASEATRGVMKAFQSGGESEILSVDPHIPVPIFIPSGTRIAIRGAGKFNGGSCPVTLFYVEAADLEDF